MLVMVRDSRDGILGERDPPRNERSLDPPLPVGGLIGVGGR